MSEPSEVKQLLPITPYLEMTDQGDPHLVGSRCRSCGEVFLGRRSVCGACGSRDQMDVERLADRGELYVYSIVHRSFPDVETPFISAVVDLEGGGTIKGTLEGVEPDPEKVRLGMPVEVVYKKAPRQDEAGNEYLMYSFRPAAGRPSRHSDA